MRVLIAEDDATSRLILQITIESIGHECLIADDGIRAWQLFQESDIDVVISDWMMPGIDGVEFCRRVRSHPRPSYVSFVFLTSLGEKERLLEGITAGADDYLTKPLDPEELRVRLMVAARLSRLHRQIAEQANELARLNNELYEQARTDPLTRLNNRLRLREHLDTLAARVERYGHSYCALMCDVDFFKRYNDHHGHLAGDEVLRQVAQTIMGQMRRGDTAYRYGGEEFLMIMPEQTLETAAVGAERLRRAVEGLAIAHNGKNPSGVVTLSIGVAECRPGNGISVDRWLQQADDALYQAKQAGRNRVALYRDSAETKDSG